MFNKLYFNSNYRNKIRIIIFYLLFILTLIQQMPIVKDVYYDQIRRTLYLFFGFFSIYSFLSIKKYFKYKIIILFTFVIFYSIILSFILGINSYSMIITEVIIPFGIMLCSLKTDYNKKQLNTFIIIYCIISAIVGLSLIFYYGDGFKITKLYFLDSKNQVGPILGISTIICSVGLINNKQYGLDKCWRWIYLILFVALTACIIVLRNRGSMLGIFLIMILIFIKEFEVKFTKKNLLLIYTFIAVLAFLIIYNAFDPILDFINKALFLNYDKTNLNSISAGRVDIYKQSIEFIKHNILLGELSGNIFEFGIPHNYILNKLVNYGVIGSLPFISFYIFLFKYVINLFTSKRVAKKFTLPLWVMFFSLIVSFFEYTYPFGPGVSQIMLWFLLGQYIKYNPENYEDSIRRNRH